MQTSCDVYDFGVRLFDIFAPPSAPYRKDAHCEAAAPTWKHPWCGSCRGILQSGVCQSHNTAEACSYECECDDDCESDHSGKEAHWECVKCDVCQCSACKAPPSAWDLTLISSPTLAPLVAQCLHDDSTLRASMDTVLMELERIGPEYLAGKALHQQVMHQLVSPLQHEQLEQGLCMSCTEGSGSGALH